MKKKYKLSDIIDQLDYLIMQCRNDFDTCMNDLEYLEQASNRLSLVLNHWENHEEER